MIENLSVLFASGDLKFAHDLPLRAEIEEDLASFSLQTTAAGNQIITQPRSAGGHGDLGIVGADRQRYNFGQSDLLAGLGGGALKPTSERKLAEERKTVMIAYAFGLDEHIPLALAKKVGLEPGPNPPVPQSDPRDEQF
ncbi:MAG: hypothetical protein PSN37_03940 [Alphaproteobacteria bacterium]|nr:hypothetical protein [Alphaproteobacteria bacterium]